MKDNSLLIVIAPDSAQNLIKDYSLRWGSETLFGIFKSRGFNLEDTHLTDSERLSRLFAKPSDRLMLGASNWSMVV